MTQPPLNLEGDICRNYHGGAEPSVEAHRSTPGAVRASLRERIFDLIRAMRPGGLTCDQIEAIAEGCWTHQSVKRSVSALKKAGRIEKTGEKRPTRSGAMAAVYRVVNE